MVMVMNPWQEFLGYKSSKRLMTGQFTVAYLLVKAVRQHRDKRGDLAFTHEIIQNGRSGNGIKVGQAVKNEEEPVRFPARCVTWRRVDPNTTLIIEKMTAQAMHL